MPRKARNTRPTYAQRQHQTQLRSTSGQLGDMFGAMVFTALGLALVRGRAADDISAAGNAFSASLRAAQGLPPRPTADEQLRLFTDRWMRGDAELADLEADLDVQLGIKARNVPPPKHHASSWHPFAKVSDIIEAARDAGVNVRRSDILDQ